MFNRYIYHYDNGTFVNYSKELEDYNIGTAALSIVAAQDYIIIGTAQPFNFLYFKSSSASVDTSLIESIEVYNSPEWSEVVDISDETVVAGKTMAQSGFVTFLPDRKESWNRVYDTRDESFFSSIAVYDMYWTRIKFTADCAFTLSWVGQLFSNDTEMAHIYPDLMRTKVKDLFGSDYQDQAKVAADIIIKDLISKKMVWNENQILHRQDLNVASIHRVAEIVYGARGAAYEDDRAKAKARYEEALIKSSPVVDLDEDGIAIAPEKMPTTGSFYR
jgi:hypothetical protein